MLTDLRCKSAATEGRAVRKLPDAHGLYLWVQPGGKCWRFRYRLAGKEKTLSLGVYPDVGLKQARQKRDEARVLLEQGIDPSQARKQAKRNAMLAVETSFEAVAREWYGKQFHAWVPSHAKDVLRRLEANLFPDLGKRPIGEITAPELLACARKIEHRGAYDLAHRVVQMAGQVFRYGIATGRCAHDIAHDLRGALSPHVKKNQAAVRPEELPALLCAIADYEAIGDRQTRCALELLCLTFVRTNELTGATWEEIDTAKALWTIPAERMKMDAEHLVPLSSQSLAILKELETLAGSSRFVFPGRNPGKPISNNTMLFALYRLGYKGKMTGHGFRAVASTILNEQGWRADVIERQLAHFERDEVRGAYNRAQYLPERKKMMQAWANYLDGSRAGHGIKRSGHE